jgi:hypothetical protein
MTLRSLRLRTPGAVTAALATVLAAVLGVALLASLLVSPAQAMPARPATAAPSAAPGTDPSQDYPRMPRECVAPSKKIPVEPVACSLAGFDAARPTVLLWGDSHAWMFIPALQAAAAGRDVNLVVVTMGSCPPMNNAVATGSAAPACYRSNALGIQTARRLAASGQPYRIILSGSWERYVLARQRGDRRSYIGRMAAAMRDGLPRLVRTLDALGADVDVIGQVATVPGRRGGCPAGEEPYACAVPRARALPDATRTGNYLARTLRPLLGARRTIDVTPYFCTALACEGTVGSTLTWFDDLHISASMSTEMAPYFAPTVDAVAPPAPEEPCAIPIICP